MSGDGVRISNEEFRATYDKAFCTWSTLHALAVAHPRPPVVRLGDVFRALPRLPRNGNVRLVRETIARERRVCVYGVSTWGASSSSSSFWWRRGCLQRLPSFQLPAARVEVAATKMTTLITETPTTGLWDEWFPGGPNCNYIAVLALAWSYTLSARWAETMPKGACTVAYSEASTDIADIADTAGTADSADHNDIIVDIGDADADEGRWWSAILADGCGWRATMRVDGETFVAPWSVQRQGGHRFLLACHQTFFSSPSPPRPASSLEAGRYLSRFCARHGLADQSQAALSAVLLFPSMGRGQTLRLPISVSVSVPNHTRTDTVTGKDRPRPLDWRGADLDRLFVLSCYTRGLRPILLSVFYEPSVQCNAVSPWLQGTMAAIDGFTQNAPLVLCRMLMLRSPEVSVSFLWLGVFLLGLQDKLLKEARRGQMPIDLLAAVWSGTTQTFLQQPTSGSSHDASASASPASVTHADECRLLFLSQADRHRRLPIVPWPPFGATPLDDVDVEVRAHAACKQHQLQYQGFTWVVQDDTRGRFRFPFKWFGWFDWLSSLWNHVLLILSRFGRVSLLSMRRTNVEADSASEKQVSISISISPTSHIPHEAMDPAKDGISENETRSIFSWLRSDGWPRHERSIWHHEWFADLDSDSDDKAEESSLQATDKLSATALWISKLSST